MAVHYGAHLGVYVVGGHALKTWSGINWQGGDVDLLLVGFVHETGLDSVSCIGDRRDIPVFGDRLAGRTQSAVPQPINQLGKFKPRYPASPVKFSAIDVLSCPTGTDVAQMMDELFDLNICRIAYQVLPYTPRDLGSGIKTFFMCAHRMGYAFPGDVRRMIGAMTMETLPMPSVMYRWVTGNTFDPAAAMQTPGHPAILQWERSGIHPTVRSSSEVGRAGGYYRGLNRYRKYAQRGFEIAETPSRLVKPPYRDMGRWHAAHMAKKYVKKRRKTRDEREVQAVLGLGERMEH